MTIACSPATQPPLPPMSAPYLKRTRQIIDNMRKRFGNILPFELDEFRAWLLGRFGDEGQAMRCPYCQRMYITVLSCVIDHRQPASRGGELSLANLLPCCQHCNDIKGALGADAFAGLLRWLETIDPQDAQEIMRRLEICYKLAASRAAMQRRGK